MAGAVAGLAAAFGAPAAGVLFAVPFAPWLRAKAEKSRLAPVWSVGLSLGLLALFVVCSSFLIKQTYNPFIYFQF